MKLLTLSKAHLPRFKCVDAIEGWPVEHIVCVHNEEQKEKLQECDVEVVVLNAPDNIDDIAPAWNREAAERRLIGKGEWYAWMDDNVSEVTKLESPYYSQTNIKDDYDLFSRSEINDLFFERVDAEHFEMIRDEMFEEVKRVPVSIYGFAIETNPFYRINKWAYFTYCRTSFCFMKAQHTPWMPFPGCKLLSDMWKTIESVDLYGAAIVNRFVKPIKNFHEAGGIGSLEERMPHLIRSTQAFCTHADWVYAQKDYVPGLRYAKCLRRFKDMNGFNPYVR